MSTGRYDVVIIGSGISSLTCAVLLAKRGKSVCVLEQYNKPGGYMHCFSRGGARFDTGAHYVGAMGEDQPFRVLLEYLGVFDETLFAPLDPEGFDVLSFPDRKIELPVGYERTIATLTQQFPSEEEAIRGYFAKVREVVTHFPTYEFDDEMDAMAVLYALDTPLSQVISELTSNRTLQGVLTAYSALHGVHPDEVSFGMHAIVTDSLIRGPYGLARGGDALTQAYCAQIERGGGRVLMRKRVSRIESSGRSAQAVITADGERFEAEWVISGIHPKRTFELLSDASALTPAFSQRLSNLKESEGLFGIYGICSDSLGLNSRKNYYFFESDKPGDLLTIREKDQPPIAVFLCPAQRVRGETRGGGMPVNVHAAAPLAWFEAWQGNQYRKRSAEYAQAKEVFARCVIQTVERHLPGFAAGFKILSTSTPLTNLHFNGSPEGSAYGLYHSIRNTGARAIGPRTHVGNLLLTGQNCLFPGLLGASIAGLRTAGHILGIKPILRELKEFRA